MTHTIDFEDRFYALFESVPNVSVQGYLADGTVQYWNNASERLYGYTAKEAIGQNLLDLIIPDNIKEEVRRAIYMMGEMGVVVPASELTLRRKDGSLVTVFSSHSVTSRSDGSKEFFCVDIDISEQKKAHAELIKAHDRNKALLDAIPDMIFVLDRDGVIIDYHADNDKEDLYVAPSEFLNRRVDDVLPSHVVALTHEKIREVLVGRKPAVGTYELSVNGEVRYYESRYVQCGKNEMLSIVRDITQSKITENNLIQAIIRAEESDRLKTAFINNISHEIRTPLNGIMGFGHIMAYSNFSERERHAHYKLFQKSADRLLQTVTDYMDISMISTLSVRQNRRCFDLNELLFELLEKGREMLADKNVRMQLDLPVTADGVHLFTDRELLQKVLCHLLDNAAKFTEEGSIIFGYHHFESEVKFFVSDTGSGISFEKLGNIFDVFIQEDTAINRGYEGSGLGLAIVKGLVSLMGGSVDVESEKGKGSTFSFRIPCEVFVGQDQPGKPPLPSPDHSGHRLLLVVEDIDTDYRFVRIMLGQEGYDTMHARNGLEAVEFCKKHPEISLVLMDIKLPVMDGIQATRLIKELRADLPVIGISAYAKMSEEHMAKHAGCDDFIPKPIYRDFLIKTVKKYLPASNALQRK